MLFKSWPSILHYASESVETQALPGTGGEKARDQRSRDGKIISLQTVFFLPVVNPLTHRSREEMLRGRHA